MSQVTHDWMVYCRSTLSPSGPVLIVARTRLSVGHLGGAFNAPRIRSASRELDSQNERFVEVFLVEKKAKGTDTMLCLCNL